VRCLVTGVAGFIGSHLAQRLLEQGHEVVGVDCFTRTYELALKQANVGQLREHEKFRFVRGDLAEMDLHGLLEGVEVVFHMAAQAGVRSSWGKEFQLYLHHNVFSTQRLLEACREMRPRRLVYASSSSVYGDQSHYPSSEEVVPRPISPYGVTKLAAEHLCVLYWKSYQVPSVSLRYFTVYGPRQRPDMAFHRFLKAIWGKTALTIYGDGSQSRDFTYVSDIVDANLRAVEAGQPGKVYNIGGGARATLREVLGILEEVTGNAPLVSWEKPELGDVRHTMADLSLAKQELGYQPRVGLREGLARQWAWMCDWLEKESGFQVRGNVP
jgi:nucleoside-diphosphate-sugar epimerase